MRQALSIGVAVLLVATAVAAVPASAGAVTVGDGTGSQTQATGSSHDACARFSVDAPENPDGDRLGWENGCWANESLSVTVENGLNETELDAVIGRSMARVETIRELEFERTVPVEVVSTAAYRREIGNLTGNTTTANRLHQNAKWEAMFVLNETTDAISVRQSTFVNGTSGFYSPSRDEIRVVSSDPSAAPVDELTLGHELVHALQDQRFNTAYNRSTVAADHAANGIVEGDADYVEAVYSQRCESEWACSQPESRAGSSGGINVGLQVNTLVPYAEGAVFVQTLRDQGGWAAVNDVYANPPASSEQVIHPEKYPDERPRAVRIDHRPTGEWRVLDLEGGVDHAAFGEGGLYTMFWYATYERTQAAGTVSNVVIPYRNLFNFEEGTTELRAIGPYNYAHPVTEGWDGDRLVPYVTNESAATNETGYVWKFAWDSEADAREFHDAYLELLDYRGGEAVSGYTNVYTIPEGTEFSDSFAVTLAGDTVVVVNGPTVADLESIRPGSTTAVATATPTASPTDVHTPTATPTATTAPATSATPSPETTADGPGFGGLVALSALAATVGALWYRRRR